MEYCFHARAGAPSCPLKFFDKLQKWICRTAVHFLSLLNHWLIVEKLISSL